jgi:hypothetical protein
MGNQCSGEMTTIKDNGGIELNQQSQDNLRQKQVMTTTKPFCQNRFSQDETTQIQAYKLAHEFTRI